MYVSALTSSTTDIKSMESIKKEPLNVLEFVQPDNSTESRYPAVVYPPYDTTCYTTIAYPTSHQPTVYTGTPFNRCARPLSPCTVRTTSSTSCASEADPATAPTSTTSPLATPTRSSCTMSPSSRNNNITMPADTSRNITMPADTTTLHTSPELQDKSDLSPTAGSSCSLSYLIIYLAKTRRTVTQ